MRFLTPFALLAGAASAASSWSFSDGAVEVTSKGSVSTSYIFADVQETVQLGQADRLKVSLTAKDGSKAKRPHQAFLMLKEKHTGLEAPYALTLKESGKGTVELTQKDLPVQLLTSTDPLEASLVIGSFGSTKGAVSHAFNVAILVDPNVPRPQYEAPLRYGKKPEIHHIFRDDPKSPPKIISLVFALAVVATVPLVLLGWAAMGANLDHAAKAVSGSVSHILFFGSIIAMEGVYFLYYSGWKLFTVLPFMSIIGLVAFLSGSKALGEVQRRRLAGER